MSENQSFVSVAEAAEILGVSRPVVYLRMHSLGITPVRTGESRNARIRLSVHDVLSMAVNGGFMGRRPKSEKAIARRDVQRGTLSRVLDGIFPRIIGALEIEDKETRLATFREVGAAIREARSAT